MRLVLTEEEVQKFEDFADNPKRNKTLRSVAAWFVFSCRTGLRYSDLNNFKGFVNGRVLIQTQKTGEIVSLFATKKIIQASERLTNNIITNQKMNSYLKDLAVTLEINKRVTVHQGRHFFSVSFLEKGGDLFTLSKLLGHTSVKTTSVYSKISNRFLDAEMKRVFG